MIAYIIRRCLYAIPIVVGVNFITFALFFYVNSPDNMARVHLGNKRVTPDAIEKWKRDHQYNLPLFYNDGWDRVRVRPLTGARTEFPAEDVKAGDYRLDLNNLSDHRLKLEVTVKAASGGTISRKPFRKPPAAGQAVPENSVLMKLRTGFRSSLYIHVPAATTLSIRIQQEGAPAEEAGPAPGEEPGESPESGEGEAEAAPEPPPLANLELLAFSGLDGADRFTKTIFYTKSISLFWFDFGKSDVNNVDIGHQIKRRMFPSLAFTVPTFVLGTMLYIAFAMILAFFRSSYLDIWGLVVCVVAMSVSSLFYIIGLQFLFGKTLNLVPISGFDPGREAFKFLALPIVIGVLTHLGASSRFYRTIFLEEINKDYIRTARAKGLGEGQVLFKHALKNAMIPILTSVVMELPFLFMGSLLMEAFFAIPGLGSFTIDALNGQDFAIVRSMVYLGSLLYILGLLLTDISYTLVDPRVRFS